MKDFRTVLDKVQLCIERDNGATESQLKGIWNDLSTAISEHEKGNTADPTVCACGNKHALVAEFGACGACLHEAHKHDPTIVGVGGSGSDLMSYFAHGLLLVILIGLGFWACVLIF